ncbi:MAG TPA: ankyrin repeat domain-containing protein [Stellaceae bacterium]|nr:ankyrin repeat domain-containing protein [Stellaceae bacterium]
MARWCRLLGVVLVSLILAAPAARADLNPFSAYWNNVARATEKNDVGKVQTLLSSGSSPNDTDENGRTGLHIAATNGNIQIVAILIKAGAKIDQRDKIGETPLHYAAERAHLEIIKLLLDVGAPVDTQDKNGMTPLMLAARNGQVEIVRTLLARGASPNKSDFTGRDAASWALDGHRPMVVQLIKQAAARK